MAAGRSRGVGTVGAAARAAALVGALAASALTGCATGEVVDDPLVARVYDAIGNGGGRVTVRNDGGVITLGGFVEGVGTERAYVDAVSRIEGVTRVESDLIARGDDG